MKLLSDWKSVLKRAWSMKMIGFAAFLEVAQNVVPVIADYVPWWVTVLVLGAAGVARLLSQGGDDVKA
jgi:hypothetical protein